MKKVALIAYTGELMCFAHVLLYADDFAEKGYEVTVIIEGAATKLITELGKDGTPFSPLYAKVKEKGLIGCICKACSVKVPTGPRNATRLGVRVPCADGVPGMPEGYMGKVGDHPVVWRPAGGAVTWKWRSCDQP